LIDSKSLDKLMELKLRKCFGIAEEYNLDCVRPYIWQLSNSSLEAICNSVVIGRTIFVKFIAFQYSPHLHLEKLRWRHIVSRKTVCARSEFRLTDIDGLCLFLDIEGVHTAIEPSIRDEYFPIFKSQQAEPSF